MMALYVAVAMLDPFMPMLAPNQGHSAAKLTTSKLFSLNPVLACQKLFENSYSRQKLSKQRILLN